MAGMHLAMRQLGQRAAAGAQDSLLVMTYNVLAQTYVKSSFFPYCDPITLRWKNRSKKLEEVFNSLPVKPHVICLQEVDYFDQFWTGVLRKLGYEGLYVQKQGRKKEGIAIFWDDTKLKLEDHVTIGLDMAVGDESDCSEDLLERTIRGSVGLITQFSKRHEESGKEAKFVVATTHLFWDPLQEDVKLLQTRRMQRRLAEYNAELKLPLIFTGDFNSLPDSEVYKAVIDKHQYRSAYAEYDSSETPAREPEFTNVNGLRNDEMNREIPGFIGTLDYIFYQSRRLHPVALLEIMSREEATKERSLPSTFSPSDHLPLICEFALDLE